MGIGKYSPTVTASYMNDEDWFTKIETGDFVDPEGYDMYGYSGQYGDGPDRAGHTEFDYMSTYTDLGLETDTDEIVYYLYEQIRDEWAHKLITFSGPAMSLSIV